MTDIGSLAVAMVYCAVVAAIDFGLGQRIARKGNRGDGNVLARFRLTFRSTAACGAIGGFGLLAIEHSTASPVLVFIATIGITAALHGLSELADLADPAYRVGPHHHAPVRYRN